MARFQFALDLITFPGSLLISKHFRPYLSPAVHYNSWNTDYPYKFLISSFVLISNSPSSIFFGHKIFFGFFSDENSQYVFICKVLSYSSKCNQPSSGNNTSEFKGLNGSLDERLFSKRLVNKRKKVINLNFAKFTPPYCKNIFVLIIVRFWFEATDTQRFTNMFHNIPKGFRLFYIIVALLR